MVDSFELTESFYEEGFIDTDVYEEGGLDGIVEKI